MSGLKTKLRIKRIIFPGILTEKVGYKKLFRWTVLGGACAIPLDARPAAAL